MRIGFQAYCPMERHKRFTAMAARSIVETALFPRYLFCRFDADEPHWNEIREIDGIGGILCNENKPSPVPDGLTEKLMRMQRLGLFDHTKAPNPFPPGSQVMLDDDGPFAELIAKVLRVRSSDRCDVLLRLSRPGNDGQCSDGEIGPHLVVQLISIAISGIAFCQVI